MNLVFEDFGKLWLISNEASFSDGRPNCFPLSLRPGRIRSSVEGYDGVPNADDNFGVPKMPPLYLLLFVFK